MIEENSFFNYGASLNDTYKMFISFKDKKPKDNSQIINVSLNQMIKKIYTLYIDDLLNPFGEEQSQPSQDFFDQIAEIYL